MPHLNPWESETRLIGLFIATGFLHGEQAQSVLLVSPPGQGKTAMIRRFRKVPTARLISDMTSNGIRQTLEKDQQVVTRHFLMPEFERLFSRDMFVSSQTANLLSNLMTGDAGAELIGRNEHDFTDRQIGVVAAMTTDVVKRRRPDMQETGLFSRFMELRVDRSESERGRVIDAMLRQDTRDLTPIQWPQFQRGMQIVTCPAGLSVQMKAWLQGMAVPVTERAVHRYLTLLRACALLNGHNTVTPFDLATLRSFTPYFEGKKDVQLVWPPENPC